MARITTRRPEEDEEEMIEDIEEEEQQTTAPPVSDRRRRRKLKRGEPVMEEADEEAAQHARKDRPTPSQRPETVRSSNPIIRLYQSVIEYFQEVNSELRKVTWLSREDTLRLTYIVVIVTAVAAAFLGLVSFIFGLLTQAMATASSATIAGIITIVIIVGVGGAWLLRDRLFGGHFE